MADSTRPFSPAELREVIDQCTAEITSVQMTKKGTSFSARIPNTEIEVVPPTRFVCFGIEELENLIRWMESLEVAYVSLCDIGGAQRSSPAGGWDA